MIAAEFMAMPAVKSLYDLKGNERFNDCFPPASIEGVIIYILAFGVWLSWGLYDKFATEVTALIDTLKPHTLQWYVNKAKYYQHGVSLPANAGQVVSDTYDTVSDKKQIVKYAVAQEVPVIRDGQEIGALVAMKVAKYTSTGNHSPAKLTYEELQGLKYYFSQVKDAGVPVSIISNDPDTMRIDMTVYYNPIILEPSPDNLHLVDAGGANVINDAVQATIEALPFNGVLKKSDITDAVKVIEGIEVVDVTSVTVRPETEGAQYTTVTGYCVPAAGYFAIDRLNVTLKPYSSNAN